MTWRPDPDGHGTVFASNDNSTYWRLYPGYPVLAVMMLRGALPYDRDMARQWAGVNWKSLNDSLRRNYPRAVATVEEERGIDPLEVGKAANQVMEALKALPAAVKRGSPLRNKSS